VTRALALVGVAELKSMLAEDNSAEVRCDFCTKTYRVDAEGLRALISGAGVSKV
jgi:redox-regulated HSP33 family molecular chaperone